MHERVWGKETSASTRWRFFENDNMLISSQSSTYMLKNCEGSFSLGVFKRKRGISNKNKYDTAR